MSRIFISAFTVIGLMLPLQTALCQFGPPKPPKGSVINGQVDIDFSSQYIWRGMELNYRPVFQPSARIGESGIEVGALANMDMTDSNEKEGKFTRLIYRGGLASRSREGDISLSYIYYDNKELGFSKTQEAALEFRYGYPLFAAGGIYWDFDNANGFYFNSSVGYIGDADPVRIIFKVGFGYATGNYQVYYFGVDEDTFLDVTASLAVELNIVGPLYLFAKGNYYELAKSGLRHSEERVRRGENMWGNGGLSLRF